jgi:hypothetical protein
MILEIDVKMNDKERIKNAGERITRKIIDLGFYGDIEMMGLMQALLSATGVDVPAIYDEMHYAREKSS